MALPSRFGGAGDGPLAPGRWFCRTLRPTARLSTWPHLRRSVQGTNCVLCTRAARSKVNWRVPDFAWVGFANQRPRQENLGTNKRTGTAGGAQSGPQLGDPAGPLPQPLVRLGGREIVNHWFRGVLEATGSLVGVSFARQHTGGQCAVISRTVARGHSCRSTRKLGKRRCRQRNLGTKTRTAGCNSPSALRGQTGLVQTLHTDVSVLSRFDRPERHPIGH